jgi:hypothetical protein
LLGAKQSVGFKLCLVAFAVQVIAALALKDGLAATFVSDAVPLVPTGVLIILCVVTSRASAGSTRMFWHLNTAAFVCLLFSQLFWLYWEVLLGQHAANPLLGDGFFFLLSSLLLAALAFRPHWGSAGDLDFQRLDLTFLLCWWFCLYLYFAVPWLTVVHEFAAYNPSNYLLVLAEQSAVIIALAALWKRTTDGWRKFYGHAACGILVFALGNLVQAIAINKGWYYSGSFYDVGPAAGALWMVYAFALGSELKPLRESSLRDPGHQGLWSARLAMAAMFSLPILAIYGYLEAAVPAAVSGFRLRLILLAMLFLGALGFFRLYIMERKLQRLVCSTQFSYDSLKAVQERIAHSQKLAALGRLAAGAAHEINNPLTAIYCYSELLTDNSSLSAQEHELAVEIREQVRRAQAAVLSIQEPGRDSA